MARLSKEEIARQEGARWALEIAKRDGIEAAEQELQFRGIHNIPCGVNRADLNNFTRNAKRNCVDTICCLAAITIRDEFGFGRDRLNRFVKRMNEKAECLNDNYCCWEDIQTTLKDETGLEFFISDECKAVSVNSIGKEVTRYDNEG